ncbi:MAG: YMGG-like glycine zipper-containing protein [Phycisphaeraceae bacterium]
MNATRIWSASRTKVAAFGLLSLMLVGCNAAQTGALYGAGLGSLIGAASNRHRSGENALIGAGIGAVAGYLFGNEVDKSNTGYGYSGNYGYPAYSQPQQVDVYYQQSYHQSHQHYNQHHYSQRGRYQGGYQGGYSGGHRGGHCDW